ncbi:MAG TPA: aldo/keto reductase [Acidimicrobiales bacterium]|nr:aldo/keto reductase [Acidimicrobiales bacterium]
MRQRPLGDSGIEVGAIGLGCMGFSIAYDPGTKDDAASMRVIQRALDVGVTLFDTSDAYGPWVNEQLVGRALAGRRSEAVIATKAGCAPNTESFVPMPDGRPEVLRQCCDASLERLGVEVIDLWQLHRADPAVPIEESVGAMGEMVAAGKVRAIGVSEVTLEQLAAAHRTFPLAALQSELSLWTRDALDEIVPWCGRATSRDASRRDVGASGVGVGARAGRPRRRHTRVGSGPLSRGERRGRCVAAGSG